MRYPFLKRMQHALEWGILSALFAVLRCTSIQTSSDTVGRLARAISPLVTSKNRVARQNLQHAFPNWDDERTDAVIKDMWENMGRYLGEFPHIAPMSAGDFRQLAEIRGEENLKAATSGGEGSLFFSAHMGNWELGAKSSWACGVPFAIVYRPLNNPWVDKATNEHRDQYQLRGLPKNASGSRELMKTLRNGQPVAILIDQKMNTGIPVPFFGRDAMTSTAIADLAVKYGYPIIPTRVERLGRQAKFRITFEPPVQWSPTGDARADAAALMRQLHSIMERWISERPEQWFWVHKRWG